MQQGHIEEYHLFKYYEKQKCGGCRKRSVGEPGKFLVLTAGGFRLEKVRNRDAYNKVPSDRIEAFSEVHVHGFKTYRDGSETAVVPLPGVQDKGQMYVYFCSTDCLRKYFGKVADRVEKETGEGRRKRRS
jgi:hypothetical protein